MKGGTRVRRYGGARNEALDLRSLAARLCRFHQAKRLKEPQGRKKEEQIMFNVSERSEFNV